MNANRDPFIRSFSSYEDACAARDAVVAAGVDRQAVELRVIDDEAGPVEGNFLIGNGRTTHGKRPAAVRTGPEVPYEENFHDAVHRGAYLLIVPQAGGADPAAITEALERFDGVLLSRPAA